MTVGVIKMNPEDQATYLSYINGDRDFQEAPPAILTSARDYLKDNPMPDIVTELSQGQSIAFSFLHNEFMKRNPVISHHICWHNEFGSGGNQGPGSGELFLHFHHRMIEDVKNFLEVPHIPGWGTSILSEDAAAAFVLPTNVTLNVVPTIDVLQPSYLTQIEGAESGSIDGKSISTLYDIDTIDELGQLIDMNYHAIGHGVLGGTMGSFESPRAPHFYSWHGHLDNISNTWLGLPPGQEWLGSVNSSQWRGSEIDAALDYSNGVNFTSVCDTLTSSPKFAPSASDEEPTIQDIIMGKIEDNAYAIIGGVGITILGMAGYVLKQKMSCSSVKEYAKQPQRESDLDKAGDQENQVVEIEMVDDNAPVREEERRPRTPSPNTFLDTKDVVVNVVEEREEEFHI